MKLYVFDGTPEEIRDVIRGMLPMGTDHSLSVEVSEKVRPVPMRSDGSGFDTKFVTTEFAHRVVTRRPPLMPRIQAVLTALTEAAGEWVPRSELRHVADYTPQQFAGLLGAFGRRMSHTEGYDEEAHFFEYLWDDEKKEWLYRLPDSVLEALKESAGSARGGHNEAETLSAPAST